MARSSAFRVEVERDWARAAPSWRDLCDHYAGTPFQQFDWLDAWYRQIAPSIGAIPRLVTVHDTRSGALVMALPLATIAGPRGQTLAFADAELTDFNAPLLGPASVPRGHEAALWRQIKAALPGHAIAELRKMPRNIRGRDNPLTALAGATDSSAASNAVALASSFEVYHLGLDRRVRMEFERSWRVLNREDDVTCEIVLDEAKGLAVVDAMDRQQRERMTEVGSTFALDGDAQRAFYRHNLGRRLAEGRVILSTIRVRGEIIGALYAIADGDTVVVLRISNAGKAWSRTSPGRLIIHKSLEHFHDRRFKVCDLSIGDYDYKRRFGIVRTPLVDLVTAMSWRGQVAATRHWAVGALRAHPVLDRHVRRVATQWSPRLKSRASRA